MEWISVKDRLPETDYLCVLKHQREDPNKGIGNVGAYSNRDNKWMISVIPADDEGEIPVTHWMPLPNPPKKNPLHSAMQGQKKESERE